MNIDPKIWKALLRIFDNKIPPAENERGLLLYPTNQGAKLGLAGAIIIFC